MPHELARLAWHLGNRHTDVQVIGERLRIRRDHVLEEMLRRLGARLTPVEAPFEPERGAYEHHAHDHAMRTAIIMTSSELIRPSTISRCEPRVAAHHRKRSEGPCRAQ